MHPILFYLWGYPIHSYGVLGALGFLTVAGIAYWRAGQAGINRDKLVDMMILGMAVGLIGARGMYVLQHHDGMNGWRDWINIKGGGMVFYGSIITGLPAMFFLLRHYRLPFFEMADIFATGFPLGHAVSRVGCFMAGCCFGKPSDLPWAVAFTDPEAVAPLGVPLHPAQLYASLYLVAIGVLVNWFYKRRRFDGQVMLLYLLSYAVMRTLNELLRGDDLDRGFFLPSLFGRTISMSQGLSLGVALVALAVFLIGARRAQRPRS